MAVDLMSPHSAKKVAVRVLFKDHPAHRAFFPPGFNPTLPSAAHAIAAAYGGGFFPPSAAALSAAVAAGCHPVLHPSGMGMCPLPPPPNMISGMLYGQ